MCANLNKEEKGFQGLYKSYQRACSSLASFSREFQKLDQELHQVISSQSSQTSDPIHDARITYQPIIYYTNGKSSNQAPINCITYKRKKMPIPKRLYYAIVFITLLLKVAH